MHVLHMSMYETCFNFMYMCIYFEIFLVDKFSLVCTREIKTTCYTQLLQIVKSKTFVKQAFTKYIPINLQCTQCRVSSRAGKVVPLYSIIQRLNLQSIGDTCNSWISFLVLVCVLVQDPNLSLEPWLSVLNFVSQLYQRLPKALCSDLSS